LCSHKDKPLGNTCTFPPARIIYARAHLGYTIALGAFTTVVPLGCLKNFLENFKIHNKHTDN
jgi:hypothetical protein